MTLVHAHTGEIVARNLADCEDVIRRGLTAAAEAYQCIRDNRLYKAAGFDWAAPVIAALADNIPAAVARQRTAEAIVRSIESKATRRTNTFMRDVLNTGALPLDWMDAASWPLSVDKERVCLRALGANDLRVFANAEEDATHKDHSARVDCVKGARLLADLIEEHECLTVADLANVQERS